VAKSEWRSSSELIESARRILAAESPMTIRQLFYRLVSLPPYAAGHIPNTKRAYAKVVRLMTKTRLEEDPRIDWEWIVDRSRSEYIPVSGLTPRSTARPSARGTERTIGSYSRATSRFGARRMPWWAVLSR
jgi:hypothetical protein